MHIVVLSGAGISAESGIQTFRDANGLWEGYDVTEVASPEGFARNPHLVLDFYNQRRKQALEVKENLAHQTIASWEKRAQVSVVTQNVDDLHERGGSSQVLHLHGSLFEVKSILDSQVVLPWKKDLVWGDLGPDGGQLRPNIVWFGEEVPNYNIARTIVAQADVLIVIGTSLQVYPAAGLIHDAPVHAQKIILDPNADELGVHQDWIKINTSAVKGIGEVSQLIFGK